MKRKNKNKGKSSLYFAGFAEGFALATMLVGATVGYFSLIVYEPKVKYTVEYQVPVTNDDIGLHRLSVQDVEAML